MCDVGAGLRLDAHPESPMKGISSPILERGRGEALITPFSVPSEELGFAFFPVSSRLPDGSVVTLSAKRILCSWNMEKPSRPTMLRF